MCEDCWDRAYYDNDDIDDVVINHCLWCGMSGCPGYCNVEDYNVRDEA